MNKIGQYREDERGHYSFNFTDNDGKHLTVSFRADYYDIDVVFNEFRNFLIASGHDVEGQVGEIYHEAYEDDLKYNEEDGWEEDSADASVQGWGGWEDQYKQKAQYEQNKLMQNQTQDKFSMDHFPNNGWPFGGLTTTDISAFQAPRDWGTINQFPTMSPLAQEQIQSWTLSSSGIQALTSADLSRWTVPSPGTIGGAKVSFGSVDVNNNIGHFTYPIGHPHGGGGILK